MKGAVSSQVQGAEWSCIWFKSGIYCDKMADHTANADWLNMVYGCIEMKKKQAELRASHGRVRDVMMGGESNQSLVGKQSNLQDGNCTLETHYNIASDRTAELEKRYKGIDEDQATLEDEHAELVQNASELKQDLATLKRKQKDMWNNVQMTKESIPQLVQKIFIFLLILVGLFIVLLNYNVYFQNMLTVLLFSCLMYLYLFIFHVQ